MEENKQFVERLVYYRKMKGLHQKDVAEALGTGIATVSGWERGAFTPKLSMIYKICGVFGISISELLDVNSPAACVYSAEEQAVMGAYRAHPEMQAAVKTLLKME